MYIIKNGQCYRKRIVVCTESRIEVAKKSKAAPSPYKGMIESKISAGLNNTLQTSFAKAFEVIFKHGIGIIEKGYNKEEIEANYDIQNYWKY